MATYNGAKYLREQLDSFLIQSRLPNEIVVSDDASTDATIDILNEFARRSPVEVRVFQNSKQLGFAANFQQALRLCRGDLICLSDQDDVWHPSKIETVVAIMERRPDVQVVINDHIITDANLRPLGASTLELVRRKDPSGMRFVHGCCTSIRSSWRDFALPIPSDRWSHDGWINELARYLGTKLVLENKLQSYRRHSSNVSTLNLKRYISRLEDIVLVSTGRRPHRLQPVCDNLIDLKERNQIGAAEGHWSCDAGSVRGFAPRN